MSKRILTGTVVKKSGAKTVAVEVVRSISHKKYGKSIKQTKKYLAHDEQEKAEVGQEVTIQEARPLSARKRWIVIENKEA